MLVMLMHILVPKLHKDYGKIHPRNKIHRIINLLNKNIFERVVSSFGIAKSTEYNGLT